MKNNITINKDIKDPEQIEDVIAHEKIHIDQRGVQWFRRL